MGLGNVVVLWRTPGYHDTTTTGSPARTWTRCSARAQPRRPLTYFGLDPASKADAKILGPFGAKSFIPTKNSNYDQIEAIAKEQGLLA